MMLIVTSVAKKLQLQDGYRVVVNNGANACQEVQHLHIQVLGGQQLKWPPGVAPEVKPP